MDKETMKIGLKLRKTRNLMGLSQKQMIHGLMTQAAYSRVERGKNGISMTHLIDILNSNHISLYDFFEVYDQDNYQNKIRQAFYARNISQLLQLKNEINSNASKDLVDLAVAVLKREPVASTKTKKELIAKLSHFKEWNEETIFYFALLMPFMDWKNVEKLTRSIYFEFPRAKLKSSPLKESIENMMLFYLGRAYQEKDKKAFKRSFAYLKRKSGHKQIDLVQFIASYYFCLFNNDQKGAKEILTCLNTVGYHRLTSTLGGGNPASYS